MPRDRDQGGPGRQARGGRPAARLQGDGTDREAAPCHARRDADLAAAAPRHLLDRRPGPADLRPEADQPGLPGLREARGAVRRGHGRGGCCQGKGRHHPDRRRCWRHGRKPADLDQVCGSALGDRPRRNASGAVAEQSARQDHLAHGRRPSHWARHCHCCDAGRGRVWYRHGLAGGDGLHHGAPVPFEHLPGRRLHAGRSAARPLLWFARQGRQPDEFHCRGRARNPRFARPEIARPGHRAYGSPEAGQPRRLAPG